MINLGDKVKDSVTGFEGIVVGKTTWLNGCTRIGIQSDVLKDGLPKDVQWIDEPQLKIILPKSSFWSKRYRRSDPDS
jgi:hypothetical protein